MEKHYKELPSDAKTRILIENKCITNHCIRMVDLATG